MGPVLVFENFLKHDSLAGHSAVVQILDFLEEGRSFRELTSQFPELEPQRLRSSLRLLLEHSLVECCERVETPTEGQWEGWEMWHPSASYFHFSTKDVKFLPGRQGDFEYLRKLAQRKPLPARFKSYPHSRKVQLRKPEKSSEFSRILLSRRTWREFSAAPVPLRKFEELLWLSFGVQAWTKIPGVGRTALKTSPSGGAMHPLEAYVMVRNVEGIAGGTYHYNSGKHRLELLKREMKKKRFTGYFSGQTWFAHPAFVIFLTSVFGRTQWKYEHPRAYRVVLAEAGHVCQTFCLTATWLGLAPFCTMALADTKIERALGVDGITESVVYAMGAGVRPKRPAMADRLRVDRNKVK